MEMNGEQRVPAPRNKVWAMLNDPEILRQSIPGAETVEKVSDTEFTASVTAKVGPVKAKVKGNITLSDMDPPNGYTIAGQGPGGAAGFGKGEARITLRDDGDETVLAYAVNASVGGKLAQIGSRLVDSAAKKMADDFFGRFNEIVAAQIVPAGAAEEAVAARRRRAAPAWLWAGILIVVVVLILLYFGAAD